MLICFLTATTFICLPNQNVHTVIFEPVPVTQTAFRSYRLPSLHAQAATFEEAPFELRLSKRLVIREIKLNPYACMQRNVNVAVHPCSAFGARYRYRL